MKLGTHNSGTGEKLVWWQRPFGALLNATSRCQSMTIHEQLEVGVKVFNLQVTMYKGEWVFSHGMCVYAGRNLLDSIALMKEYATSSDPIYFQLFLDKNFLLGQKTQLFTNLVREILNDLNGSNVHMLYAYIEGTGDYPYKNNNVKIKLAEHYWTLSWAENRSWIEKLPLPKRHAKRYNEKYIKENKMDYLMLDFIEIGNHFKEIGNHFVEIGNKLHPTTVKPTQGTTIKPTQGTTVRQTLPPTVSPTYGPTTGPTSGVTSGTTTSGIRCVLNVIGTGINAIKDKEFYFVFNNISTYTVYVKAKSGYVLPKNIEANGCQVKSWNPSTGKLVIWDIAYDGGFAYYPLIKINANRITTTPAPTDTTTVSATVTPTVTVTPTSTVTSTVTPDTTYLAYDLSLRTEGRLTNTNPVKVILSGSLYDTTADTVSVTCTSKYARFSGNDLGVRGTSYFNHVIGYIYPTGTATANYRFPITAYLNTMNGHTAVVKSNVVIYGAQTVIDTPTTVNPTSGYDVITPTPTATETVTPTATVTPTSTTLNMRVNIHFNGNVYTFNEGDNRLWIADHKRNFSLVFDKYLVNSSNTKFEVNHDWKLNNVKVGMIPDGAYSGCLDISGNFTTHSSEFDIYLNVYESTPTPTATVTVTPTSTRKVTPTPTATQTVTPTSFVKINAWEDNRGFYYTYFDVINNTVYTDKIYNVTFNGNEFIPVLYLVPINNELYIYRERFEQPDGTYTYEHLLMIIIENGYTQYTPVPPTVTPTVTVTPTSTIIYDGNSPAGNGNPRPTVTPTVTSTRKSTPTPTATHTTTSMWTTTPRPTYHTT